ncbi:hypothetical protein [Pseudomonas sp. PL-6]
MLAPQLADSPLSLAPTRLSESTSACRSAADSPPHRHLAQVPALTLQRLGHGLARGGQLQTGLRRSAEPR